MADALDVSRQSVSKWENNNAVPDLERLVKLAALFEITLDELVTGKKPEREVIPLPAPPVPGPRPISIRMITGIFFVMVGLTLILSFFLSYAMNLLVILFSIPLAIQFTLAGVMCLRPKSWDAYTICWYGSLLVLPWSLMFDIFSFSCFRTLPNLLLLFLCRKWRKRLDSDT